MTEHLKKIDQILGAKSVGDLVKGFDFSKVDLKDTTRDDYLHLDLAPSYGKLTSESIKTMDEHLKVAIAGTVKMLEKVPASERSWDKVMSVMMQNPLLEPDTNVGVHRSDKLMKASSNDFKFDGSPEAPIVKEVQTWFTKLINDQEVLDSTKIDINVMADIVAQTGATIENFETFFYKKESHEKTLIDIGILRFPDVDKPHFQVYRIKLVAWSVSERILFHSDDSNGITGEYNSRNFLPRESVIAGMKQEVVKKAASEAEALFA